MHALLVKLRSGRGGGVQGEPSAPSRQACSSTQWHSSVGHECLSPRSLRCACFTVQQAQSPGGLRCSSVRPRYHSARLGTQEGGHGLSHQCRDPWGAWDGKS